MGVAIFVDVSLQGCTNPRRQVALAATFHTVTPDICES